MWSSFRCRSDALLGARRKAAHDVQGAVAVDGATLIRDVVDRRKACQNDAGSSATNRRL
jgi:hypothetical protein